MALTLGDINQVMRKARGEARSAGVQEAMRSFAKHCQQLGNPDLLLVEFGALGTADKIVSDSPCKVYVVYGRKPTASTTDAWLKGSNSASAAGVAGDFAMYFRGTSGGGRSYACVFHDGLPMGTGFTLGCHTTVGAATKSAAADAVTGFAIVGGP